ncbi:hypothetical protein IL54_3219 [Sphingobium sp. ba1]|nr:hypothetical protein IL54_3219 [Sphingobium sp. ba1]
MEHRCQGATCFPQKRLFAAFAYGYGFGDGA